MLSLSLPDLPRETAWARAALRRGLELRISAQQRVRLVAGSSALTLDGADIELATPGSFTVRGATHEFLGATSLAAAFPCLPTFVAEETGPCDEQFRLVDENDQPVVNQKYRVVGFNG